VWPRGNAVEGRRAGQERRGKVALRARHRAREREAVTVGGEFARAPLRETRQEVRARLLPKLEICPAPKPTQFVVRQGRLQRSRGDEDRREHES
jgi:hypothetical protein